MHRKKSNTSFLLTGFPLLLMMIFLLTSCRSTVANNPVSRVPEPPDKNGEISLYMTMPDNTNPLLTNNRLWREYSFLCFDPLISLDSEYKAYNSVATSWVTSVDRFAWTLEINTNIMWHDGKSLSVEDVIFTINTVIKNNGSFYYSALKNIKSVEKISDKTLLINLYEPDSFTPEKLFVPVVPEVYYSYVSSDKNSDFRPIGSGPYKFDAYDKGKKLVLSQNPNWIPISGQFTEKNIPYVDKINLNIVTGSMVSSVESFNSGASEILFADQDDILKYAGRSDVGIFKYNTGDFSYIAFNLQSNSLKTSNFRNGIAFAIDTKRATKDFLQDAGYTAFALQPQNFLNTYLTNNCYYNAEKAKAFFSKEGWAPQNGKMYKNNNIKNGQFEFRLLVNSDNPAKVKLADSIRNQLLEIGVIAIINQQPWTQYKEMIDTGSGWDAVIMGISLSEIPDMNTLYSSKSEFNTSHYKNPDVDQLLSNLASAVDTDEKGKMLKDINSKVIADMPYLGLYFDNSYVIAAEKFSGELKPFSRNKLNGFVAMYVQVNNKTQ